MSEEQLESVYSSLCKIARADSLKRIISIKQISGIRYEYMPLSNGIAKHITLMLGASAADKDLFVSEVTSDC